MPTAREESVSLAGQVVTALLSFITQRILPASTLDAGAVIATLIVFLLVCSLGQPLT